jgi:hypothetical protein
MVLRVGKIEEGDTGVLTLTVVQDVFGLPSTSYSSGQQGSSWTPPDKTARPVAIQRLIDLPYAVLAGTLSEAELSYLKPESGYIGVMAVAPTALSINYQLQTRAAGAQFADRGQGDWTPSGTLTAPVGRLDTVLHVNMDIFPAVGDGLIVNDEVMRVDALIFSRHRHRRARLHGLTAVRAPCRRPMLGVSGCAGIRWVEYLSGETAEVRLLTRTSTETLAESAATVMALAIAGDRVVRICPGISG